MAGDEETAAVSGVPVRGQLAAGPETFLEYVEAHAHGCRALHRADAAGDRSVRRVYQRALAEQERQILAALAADPEFGPTFEERPEVRLAVRGWPAFTTAVCLEWLRDTELSRRQVRELCARALLGVLTP